MYVFIIWGLATGLLTIIDNETKTAADYQKPNIEKLNLVRDFGAIPNDTLSDHEAFEKAAKYINERKGNCELLIPSGQYIVGKQDKLKNSAYLYKGREVLMLVDCRNVKIIGEKGTKLKYDVGFYYGSFNPDTELSSNITWECKKQPYVISSMRADLGRCISIVRSSDISIENLELDGNFYKEALNNMNSFKVKSTPVQQGTFQQNMINIGGGYGDCGIQLLHTGLSILDAGNIAVKNVTVRRFGLDGIYIANSHVNDEHKSVEIKKCEIDYNGRTGIAVTGGDKIKITGCNISNTGKAHFSATGTGIDIEAQYGANRERREVTNLLIDRSTISNNSSGEILARYGLGSSDVIISNCTIISSNRVFNLSEKSKKYKFLNNKISGTKVVLYDGVNILKEGKLEIPESQKSNLIFSKNKIK